MVHHGILVSKYKGAPKVIDINPPCSSSIHSINSFST